MIEAIVTDIEGTTSSISFVKEVLFPYAANHLHDFLVGHWRDPDIQKLVAGIASANTIYSPTPDNINALLQTWITADKKETALKTLQGMIWKTGYEQGDYQAHLYPDTAPMLKKWHALGLPLYVYSSGSVAAQKLFFRFSQAGDLTPLFSGYFDTNIGHKQEKQSYLKIIEQINIPAENILFLSDIKEELDAAKACGMKTVQLNREGDGILGEHTVVTSFDDIDITTIA